MKTFGATFFTIPGPKMIWQFGELNMNSASTDVQTEPSTTDAEQMRNL
jgi:hypothetical protein